MAPKELANWMLQKPDSDCRDWLTALLATKPIEPIPSADLGNPGAYLTDVYHWLTAAGQKRLRDLLYDQFVATVSALKETADSPQKNHDAWVFSTLILLLGDLPESSEFRYPIGRLLLDQPSLLLAHTDGSMTLYAHLLNLYVRWSRGDSHETIARDMPLSAFLNRQANSFRQGTFKDANVPLAGLKYVALRRPVAEFFAYYDTLLAETPQPNTMLNIRAAAEAFRFLCHCHSQSKMAQERLLECFMEFAKWQLRTTCPFSYRLALYQQIESWIGKYERKNPAYYLLRHVLSPDDDWAMKDIFSKQYSYFEGTSEYAFPSDKEWIWILTEASCRPDENLRRLAQNELKPAETVFNHESV